MATGVLLKQTDPRTKLQYINGSLLLSENGESKILSRQDEEKKFTEYMESRPPLIDTDVPDIAPDGTHYDDVFWDNFKVSIDIMANNRQYRKPYYLEALAHQFYLIRIASMMTHPDSIISTRATQEEATAFLDSLVIDDTFLCDNPLQVAYAMELHHLRQINKSGYGETFRKCENCDTYFLTRNEIYCSDKCKAEAKTKQMQKISQDDKTKYLKYVRDRYNAQIRRAEGNNSLKEKLNKELEAFQKERKQLLKQVRSGEITEQEYVDWLKRKHTEGSNDNG